MGELPGDVTQLLNRWKAGDPCAKDELIPLVYDELRKIARSYLRDESPDHTLQATALVNELYLKLQTQRKADWESRQHFFAFAAKLMRFLLIDHARTAGVRRKRNLPLCAELPWLGSELQQWVELERALEELGTIDPDKLRRVELRYFMGCTADEAAEIEGVSKTTIDRDLRFARSWLYQRLAGA